MIDTEKLKYDLAMQSAVIKTLQHYQDGKNGNPAEIMMIKFQQAYRQLSDESHIAKLNDLVKSMDLN